MSRELLGGWLRFRLTFNTGAAFGVGSDHRWLLVFLGLTVLGILTWLYWMARDTDRRRVVALALICGGAMGNLVDRIRWSVGVIDFIDVGWWTFNLADVGITVGALLLVWSLRIESRRPELRGLA
jgi:signal peptidase II